MASNRLQIYSSEILDYISKIPDNGRAKFLIGPQKEKITIPKSHLKSNIAADILAIHEGKLKVQNTILSDDGFELPQIDPDTFQLFATLLPFSYFVNIWKEDIKAEQLLNLIEISNMFATKVKKNDFEELVLRKLIKPSKFFKSSEFSDISQSNLETLFGSGWLHFDKKKIFGYTKRWAENYCLKIGLELNTTNTYNVMSDISYIAEISSKFSPRSKSQVKATNKHEFLKQ